jgi:hypothetical protein
MHKYFHTQRVQKLKLKISRIKIKIENMAKLPCENDLEYFFFLLQKQRVLFSSLCNTTALGKELINLVLLKMEICGCLPATVSRYSTLLSKSFRKSLKRTTSKLQLRRIF